MVTILESTDRLRIEKPSIALLVNALTTMRVSGFPCGSKTVVDAELRYNVSDASDSCLELNLGSRTSDDERRVFTTWFNDLSK